MKNKNTGNDDSQWNYGIKWKEELETGHEGIDEQHKELFRLTSNLIEACEHGSSNVEEVGRTLDFLTSYTVNHFADEESLMTKNNYPSRDVHKKKHEDFKQTVTELIERYRKSGNTSELSHDVNSIIVHWLVSHILHVDRTLADFVKSVKQK